MENMDEKLSEGMTTDDETLMQGVSNFMNYCIDIDRQIFTILLKCKKEFNEVQFNFIIKGLFSNLFTVSDMSNMSYLVNGKKEVKPKRKKSK